ncbi:MAG: DUF1413 domain-containing protein [Oscillospiraceae bacterium]|nr:DUF1413 domain-containing protein [Oscillospiraceae bacterium]
MPIIKLSLTEEEYQTLESSAKEEKMTVQDYIRFKMLSKRVPTIFEPEEAVRRALSKFAKGEVFTLPDIYGEEWSKLNPRMTGVFGKRFYNYVEPMSEIEFVGMTHDKRRAAYTIK